MSEAVSAAETVLVVSDLHKSYGPVQALRGLDFAVPHGAFFGLFGRNGAGKTTALDCITGLLGRDKGRVTLLGEEVGMEPSPATKERFAYVGGHIQLYHWLTLQEHLEFIAGFYPTWDDERCRELMEVFRLPMRQRVNTLSPGMHVQFQLLMALSRHPELLIMDEPGNLDPVVRSRLMDTMIEILEAEDATVVMASHLIDELEGICDEMCVIDQGVTLTAGPVQQLIAEVREIHLQGVKATEPPEMEGIWRTEIRGAEMKVVMAGYTEQKAEALAEALGAESYEVGRLGLQEFFIALTADRE